MSQPLVQRHQLAVKGGTTFMPSGGIIPFAGSSAPSGFLLCDGSSVAVSQFPDLFAAIGYTYGGGGANFNVPDLRGRTIAGVNGGTFTSLGTTVGAETATAPLPVHAHTGSITVNAGGAHAHTASAVGNSSTHTHRTNIGTTTLGGPSASYVFSSGGSGGGITTDSSGGFHSHTVTVNGVGNHVHTGTVTVNDAGTGGAHNNIQPTISLNYIIAT